MRDPEKEATLLIGALKYCSGQNWVNRMPRTGQNRACTETPQRKGRRIPPLYCSTATIKRCKRETNWVTKFRREQGWKQPRKMKPLRLFHSAVYITKRSRNYQISTGSRGKTFFNPPPAILVRTTIRYWWNSIFRLKRIKNRKYQFWRTLPTTRTRSRTLHTTEKLRKVPPGKSLLKKYLKHQHPQLGACTPAAQRTFQWGKEPFIPADAALITA